MSGLCRFLEEFGTQVLSTLALNLALKAAQSLTTQAAVVTVRWSVRSFSLHQVAARIKNPVYYDPFNASSCAVNRGFVLLPCCSPVKHRRQRRCRFRGVRKGWEGEGIYPPRPNTICSPTNTKLSWSKMSVVIN